MQAQLRTRRLVLAPLAESDLPFIADLNADPEVVRFLYPRPLTPEESAARLRGWLDEAADGLGMWVGWAADEPVGLWMLMAPDGPRHEDAIGEAELGYRLPRRSWRQGYATEGSRELLRHAFVDLGLRRVYAETMAVNEGSRATMAAAGLAYVTTFQPDFVEPLPGAEHGEVEYAVTAQEWRRRVGIR